MRILLVADIHANWPALQAIQEPHDVCLCLGDLVDYGVEPGPCIGWARNDHTLTVRGNHDHGLAQGVAISGKNGYKHLTSLTRPYNRDKLGPEEVRFLARLPISRLVTLDNTRFYLVHASPRDPLDEYAPADVEYWKRRLVNIEADVICVGHTHQPYVLEVGDQLVINPGSVGQPRDGDPRVSYAVIEGNNVELKRIEYPVDQTVRAIDESGLPDPTKEKLIEVVRNGRHRPA